MLPIAEILSQFKPLKAIRDGIAMSMPLIIVGSIFLIAGSFPIDAWTTWIAATSIRGIAIADLFNKIVNASFGLLGVISCYGIASSYAAYHETDGQSAGIIAIASYFAITPSIFTSGKVISEGMPYDYLGSKGLFIAIIIGLITGGIFQWFINHDIQIKMPETVPSAVSKSFSALIPGAVIISLFGLIYAIFGWLGLGNVHDLLLHVLSKPLGFLGGTLGGTLIAVFLNSAFWFIGIHGSSIVNSIMSPIWLMNTDANRVLFKAGKLTLAHGGKIIAAPFIDNFVYMGGGGATLGLVLGIAILVSMKKASKQLQVLAPITVTPGIFNINEPTMFGMPIVLNTSLIIPFLIAPMFNACTTYFAMAMGIVPLCIGAVVPWTMPPIISGFLATNSFMGSALQAFNLVIDILIYLPFLMAQNKQQKIQEAAAEGIDLSKEA
ncbi:permease IIC component [Companilactobacillus paralimentarius]|uniref:Permease IIC component n=2 Tax=Companilactobacillus bobalius TaxID=2801451 RepID=A0A202FA20_9LACO|nr:cellobiose-specific PTS IIC [Companilactobacillus bobalius DSM 19674]OVE97334.1 Cellobiose permease IIC component [Companilactobacillus bobalius]GEO58279.1 permease IIC component [Companilactobacillus paralimentarius]